MIALGGRGQSLVLKNTDGAKRLRNFGQYTVYALEEVTAPSTAVCGNRFHVVWTFTQISSEPQIIRVPKDFCNCLGIGRECFHQYSYLASFEALSYHGPIHHIFYETGLLNISFWAQGWFAMAWNGREKNTIPLSLKKLGVLMEWHKP